MFGHQTTFYAGQAKKSSKTFKWSLIWGDCGTFVTTGLPVKMTNSEMNKTFFLSKNLNTSEYGTFVCVKRFTVRVKAIVVFNTDDADACKRSTNVIMC